MAVTTTTDAAELIEKRVSLITTETLIQNSVMMGAVRDFSSMVGPGMDRLDIPLFNELAIQDVSQTAEVVPQTIDPEAALMLLDRHKTVPWAIGDRVSVQSKLNMVSEAVKNGARSLAAEIDNNILSVIKAGTSAAGPDHVLPLTASEPLTDIRAAKKLLDDANVPKSDRYIVASPGFVQSIMGDSNVINADKYGATNPIQAGFLTDIFGFRVLESSSSELIDDGFIALHKDCCAFARQISVSLKSEYKVLAHRDEYSLSHLYGTIYTDSAGTRSVVFNAAGTP